MLKHASVLISLSLALLYSLGLTFHQGFLKRLGIEETQFPLTLDRTFFQGFVSVLDIGSSLGYLILAAEGVVIVALVGLFINEKISKFNWSKLFPSKACKNDITKDNSFLVFSINVFMRIGLVFILYMGMLVVLIISEKSGNKYAEKLLEKIELNEVSPTEIHMKNGSKPITGYSVVCSNNQCVYIVKKSIIVINQTDIKYQTRNIKMP